MTMRQLISVVLSAAVISGCLPPFEYLAGENYASAKRALAKAREIAAECSAADPYVDQASEAVICAYTTGNSVHTALIDDAPLYDVSQALGRSTRCADAAWDAAVAAGAACNIAVDDQGNDLPGSIGFDQDVLGSQQRRTGGLDIGTPAGPK